MLHSVPVAEGHTVGDEEGDRVTDAQAEELRDAEPEELGERVTLSHPVDELLKVGESVAVVVMVLVADGLEE